MRLEEREEREPHVEDTMEEEETESGMLTPGVMRLPASEREERRGDD
jgi:hypothetical protein